MAGVSAGLQQMYGLLVGTAPGTGPAFPQGSVLSRIKVFQNSSTITPAATATLVSAEQTFTITGLAASDFIVGWTLATPNVTNVVAITNVRVTAANTIGITFSNASATASLTFPAITSPNLTIYVINVDTF